MSGAATSWRAENIQLGCSYAYRDQPVVLLHRAAAFLGGAHS